MHKRRAIRFYVFSGYRQKVMDSFCVAPNFHYICGAATAPHRRGVAACILGCYCNYLPELNLAV